MATPMPIPMHHQYMTYRYLPAPAVSGTYQVDGGTWQEGLLYVNTPDQLKVLSKDRKDTTIYKAGQVKIYVTGRDTFEVVRNLKTKKGALETAFAHRLYRYGQLTAFKVPKRLLLFGEPNVNGYPATALELVVQSTTGDAVVVPVGRRAFIEAMLPLVGNCPELATQISKGKLWREDMRQILQTYARWQQANPQSATN